MTPNHEEFIEEEGEHEPQEVLRKLREKLRSCQAERQEYLDGWQRIKADFVNLRKETQERLEGETGRAQAALFTDLLPVLDSIDMALKNGSGDEAGAHWRSGLESIRAQFLTVAKRYNIEPFDPTGEPFDPALHSSVGTVPPSKEHPENTVAEVLQQGYRCGERIIRPAMVHIAQA